MEIKEQYLLAMCEQAPKVFNELRRSGAMDAHLQKKSEEAATMFKQLASGEKKLPNGEIANPTRRREIEEQVRQALIEFPQPNAPDVDGESVPQALPQNG
jgi:hypothetical protein